MTHQIAPPRLKRSFLLTLFCTGVSLAAVLPADAQQAPQEPETATTSPDVVIVTATRREEDLQDVPLAVTALSGDALTDTRIQDFSSLASVVPGPTFIPISGASGSQMMIRGLIASDDSPAFDTPVGIFIDDIYYGSVASFYPDFYDVDQIAVLRGPQGTTFGRNTAGGALQITSVAPSFSGVEGEASITVRNHNGFESTGFYNVPFTDQLAGRLSYSSKDVGGDIYNVTTGDYVRDKKVWSLRGQLLWNASDTINVLSSASYTHDNSLGDGAVLIGQGALIASLNNGIQDGKTYSDDNGKTKREIFNSFVRVNAKTPWGDLTSITGYRTLDSAYREDIDGSPVLIAPNKVDINEESQFSQELRLASPTNDTFDWLVGLYYLNQSLFRSETYTFGGLAPWRINTLSGGVANRVRISGDISTESIAPFGEGTWHINKEWDLTAGVRYTYDRKDNVTDQKNLSFPSSTTTVFFGAPKTVAAKASWDAWTPRVILKYQPTTDLSLYVSAARGFRSGGFNYAAATVAQAATPILPEESTSYEAGLKSEWFDNALQANVAVYTNTVSDLQVRSLVGTVLQVNNAGEAEIKGVELEVKARPIENLQLGLNYSNTDATFKDYRGCAGSATAPVNCTGNTIPFVPENTLYISGEYEWALGDDARLKFRVEDSWASDYEVNILNGLPGGPQFPRSLTGRNNIINSFLTYEAPGGDWKIQGWARNILDKRSVTFATNYFFYLLTNAEATGTPPLTESDRVSVTDGRSYGVTATFKFH